MGEESHPNLKRKPLVGWDPSRRVTHSEFSQHPCKAAKLRAEMHLRLIRYSKKIYREYFRAEN